MEVFLKPQRKILPFIEEHLVQVNDVIAVIDSFKAFG